MDATMTRAEAIRALTAPGQPFEYSERPIQGRPCRVFLHGPATVPELLDCAARNFAGYPYLVYEDERATFAETHRRAVRLAGAMWTLYGVQRGDRVAIAMRNYPEWVIAYLAASLLGAIPVALNAWWSAEELEFVLKDCGARLLVADAERLERVRCMLAPLGMRALSVRAGSLADARIDPIGPILADSAGLAFPPEAIQPDDDALIMYTSGTTGRPKGVASTHRSLMHAILSWKLDAAANALRTGVPVPREPFEQQFSQLLSIPLFHVSGSHVGMLLSLLCGRKLVLMYKWDVNRAIELIRRERITYFNSVATITGDLVRAAAEQGCMLDSLLNVGGGGSPRPPAQTREIPRRFPNAVPSIGWGMTETNAIGTGIAGAELLERPTTSGYGSAVLDLQVVDDAGRTVAPGREGELLVRGTSMFRTYWNRPQATADAHLDGWFRTGDVARIDDAGLVYIVDRIKDIVIRGGENISCAHVEAAVHEFQAVAEVAVLGVPDARLGEELAAVVVPRLGQPLDEARLRAHLDTVLGKYEQPRYLIVRNHPLPRIASGKLDKRGLRQDLLRELRLEPAEGDRLSAAQPAAEASAPR